MSVYQLDERLWFPPPSEYESHGIVAVGGDLSEQRLLLAYSHGIFPWYNELDPITWCCPEERMVLRPSEVKVSKSTRNLFNRKIFEYRVDSNFQEVIENCQQAPRPGQDGTWLNNDLKAQMIKLHEAGFAHSFESYQNGKLVGGLYGISVGKVFFGDSMFSKVSNGSKMAFIKMCQILEKNEFHWVDCQVYTPHLQSLGAYTIQRMEFLEELAINRKYPSIVGNWSKELKF